MSSSTVQRLPPASKSLTSDHPDIRYTWLPQTTNTWPLTSAAASDARNPTTGATLSGSHSSNSPSVATMNSSAPSTAAVIRVRARGAIALTVTPYFRSSRASTIVIDAIPAFAAE